MQRSPRPSARPALAAALLTLIATGALAGCGGPSPSPGAGPEAVTGEVRVFAAASLTGVFNAIGADFEQRHRGVKLIFNFGGTPTLLSQLQQGAAADVFASADQPNMQRAVDAGLVTGSPQIFTRNRLQIVVQAGNPKHITGLADLARPDVVYITEAPNVPAGAYGQQALARAGVKPNPRSLETDVKSVVTKVALGEADAGIVYVTDVRSGGPRVTGVDIPAAQNVIAAYPVAEVKGAANRAGARAFIQFLLSPAGQDRLAGFGFGG